MWTRIRSSRQEVFCKKGVLRNFAKLTGKHLCQSLFFNKVADLKYIKKETLAQLFSCEFLQNSKNTFFTEHLQWLLLSYYRGKKWMEGLIDALNYLTCYHLLRAPNFS